MATPQVGIPLPERKTDFVRIVYPKVGKPVFCTSLSSRVFGVKMHWAGKHSLPCLRGCAECSGCKLNLHKLWYGWILATVNGMNGNCLVQLTETAVRCVAELRDSRYDLRSAKIVAERIADANGSTVRATVTLNTWKDHSKTPDPDVWAALMRFYKIDLPTTTFGPHGEGEEP